jgi:hypothetical protein
MIDFVSWDDEIPIYEMENIKGLKPPTSFLCTITIITPSPFPWYLTPGWDGQTARVPKPSHAMRLHHTKNFQMTSQPKLVMYPHDTP